MEMVLERLILPVLQIMLFRTNIFFDGTSENSPSGIYQKPFATPGVNTYTVTVIAFGRVELQQIHIQVTVLSDFKDEQAVQFLTGGASKKMVLGTTEVGHLGVGPMLHGQIQILVLKLLFYGAQPNEKLALVCKSEMTFH
jgi:hypothetical protein